MQEGILWVSPFAEKLGCNGNSKIAQKARAQIAAGGQRQGEGIHNTSMVDRLWQKKKQIKTAYNLRKGKKDKLTVKVISAIIFTGNIAFQRNIWYDYNNRV